MGACQTTVEKVDGKSLVSKTLDNKIDKSLDVKVDGKSLVSKTLDNKSLDVKIKPDHDKIAERVNSTSDNRLKQLEKITKVSTVPQTYDFDICKVISVYDGDTITIAAWHGNKICRFSVRLYGVDCDEMKGGTEITRQNAKLAKQFVMELCLNKIVYIEVLNGKIKPNSKARYTEKYGRLLAIISIESGETLNRKLIEYGLARPYFGGKKSDEPLEPKWTPDEANPVDDNEDRQEESLIEE